jgi:PAS domain-containing protein
MERAFALKRAMPMDPQAAAVFRGALSSGGALSFEAANEGALPPRGPSIHSQTVMAVFPKGGEAYLLGLHHCSETRLWTAQDKRLFEEIGYRLTEGLSRALMVRSLRESERRLDEAQHIAHVGYWDRDLVTGQMTLSDEACRIFGFPPDERILDLPRWHKRWLALIHPSDRTRLAEAVETALRGGPRYDTAPSVSSIVAGR